MNTWPIRLLLSGATLTLVVGATRFILAGLSWSWYTKRDEDIDAIEGFSCTQFHTIANRPKPWTVRLNDWLEAHHV
jgi:hypothetical protein